MKRTIPMNINYFHTRKERGGGGGRPGFPGRFLFLLLLFVVGLEEGKSETESGLDMFVLTSINTSLLQLSFLQLPSHELHKKSTPPLLCSKLH
jgi:hypothetical protein